MDLSNAFNAVRTDKLEQILRETGVPDDIRMWISSFLRNRKIIMHLRNKTIDRTIQDGLPQGDVLSPTLFNVYTADLHKIECEDVVLVQFADDFGILVRAKNLETLNRKAQEYTNKFSNEASELNLVINPAKTKALLFQNNDKELNITINGTAVETVKDHRYLGIIFDRYLSFRAHINSVKSKVQERLNMLKILNGVKSGAHPQTLVRIHTALCRSVMEYGSSVYNNARSCNRKKLYVLNNQCLRKVTGATKTTPLNTLAAISGQEPIEYKLEYVTEKEITRHLSRQNEVAKQLVDISIPANCDNLEKYTYLERIYWQNKDIFENLQPYLEFTASKNVEINDELELLDTTKKHTAPAKMKQAALFAMNGKYKHKAKIYTDASKDGTTCSVGVYIENTNQRLSFRLIRETSITSAEIIAIHLALKHIERGNLKNYVVFTDSKSACTMLNEARETKGGEKNLVEILSLCEKSNTAIQWIPSHVDIRGNEIADQLAKQGISSQQTLDNVLMVKDVEMQIKKKLEQRVAEWYEAYSQEKGKAFYEIQPTFSKNPWFKGVNLKGKEIKVLNRLMAGHDYSKKWLATLKIVENPNCETCSVPETAEHTILICPQYKTHRSKYSFEGKFKKLTEMFKTSNISIYKEILQFIREIKMEF